MPRVDVIDGRDQDSAANHHRTLHVSAADATRSSFFAELALVAQDAGEWPQAQRVYAHYIGIYPQHPSLPEVLLRQGLLYREMGATGLAIAKFYAVMTSSLNLNLERLENYERLVLHAQSEIGETHFSLGRFEEAADCYRRLLKRPSPQLNQEQIVALEG